jgi:hypothetical protein
LTPSERRALGGGLMFGRVPALDPIGFLGSVVADADVGVDALTRIRLTTWVRLMGLPCYEETLATLLERLEDVADEPWRSVYRALEQIALVEA